MNNKYLAPIIGAIFMANSSFHLVQSENNWEVAAGTAGICFLILAGYVVVRSDTFLDFVLGAFLKTRSFLRSKFK